MKLLVDQNLEPNICDALSDIGHDSLHTNTIGLATATDEELLELCRKENRLFITADIRLTKYLASTNSNSPNILIVRGYGFGIRQSPKLIPDLIETLDVVSEIVSGGDNAVFSCRIDRPVRVRLLPFEESETGAN